MWLGDVEKQKLLTAQRAFRKQNLVELLNIQWFKTRFSTITKFQEKIHKNYKVLI